MTKASRKNSANVTVYPPGFIGIPLYVDPETWETNTDQVRKVGESLAAYASGNAVGGFITPNGRVVTSKGDQQMLIRWLRKLPNLPPRMLKEIAELAGAIEPMKTEIQTKVSEGAVFISALTICLPTTGTVALGYLMASVLSSGYRENFGCCPECGTWFFDIPSGRPMKKYCSPEHSNRYRQRKYQGKRK